MVQSLQFSNGLSTFDKMKLRLFIVAILCVFVSAHEDPPSADVEETSKDDEDPQERHLTLPSFCYLFPCPKGKHCRSNPYTGKPECVCSHPHNGKCVYCEPPKVFKTCPTACPKRCGDIFPKPCIAICNLDDHCQCREGYVELSEKNRKCVRPSQCPKHCPLIPCPPDRVCKLGKCKCKKGLIETPEGRCVDACKLILCAPMHKCVNGECIKLHPCALIFCEPGKTCVNGKCVEKCLPHCPLYSDCIDGKCICHEGYHMENWHCIKLHPCALIFCETGKTCVNGKCVDICHGQCPPHSHCIFGRCKCYKGYQMVDRKCKKKCLPHCPLYSDCIDGKCICHKGYYMENWHCIKLHPCALIFCEPGKTCVNGKCVDICHGQCPPNSYCIYGRCKCYEGYQMVDGKCKKQCIPGCPPYSICVHGECLCHKGYHMENWHCIKSCPSYCPPLRKCVDGTCKCIKWFHENDHGKCVPNSLCFLKRCPPNYQCKYGKCVCIYPLYSGKCLNSCYGDKCIPPNVCHKGKCTCPIGNKYIDGKCIAPSSCPGGCRPGALCVNGECICPNNRPYDYMHGCINGYN